MTPIEINSAEWTIEAFRATWAEDGNLTAAEAAECADAQYAWLVNNTGTQLRGWTYTGRSFAGAIRGDAPQAILALLSDSADYVISALPEINADVAADSAPVAAPAPCSYHRDSPTACDLRTGGADVALYRVSGDAWCSGALTEFKAGLGANDPAVRYAVKIA